MAQPIPGIGKTPGLIDIIITKLMLAKLISMEPFRAKVNTFISTQYDLGVQAAEVQFNMNFVPDDAGKKVVADYVQDNLQTAGDELENRLRGELTRAKIDKASVAQYKKKIREVFKDPKFKTRLKMIIRTEKQRANNYGALDGAKQSGLKIKKYLDVIDDTRTSDICLAEKAKYSKEKPGSKKWKGPIPLEQDFVVKPEGSNKTIRAQAPPFHPNCRTVIRFERIE